MVRNQKALHSKESNDNHEDAQSNHLHNYQVSSHNKQQHLEKKIEENVVNVMKLQATKR